MAKLTPAEDEALTREVKAAVAKQKAEAAARTEAFREAWAERMKRPVTSRDRELGMRNR